MNRKTSLVLLAVTAIGLTLTAGCGKLDLASINITKNAVKTLNVALCDQIKNAKEKEICIKGVEDGRSFDRAVEGGDTATCANIQDGATRDACVSAVSNTNGDKRKQTDEAKQLTELESQGDVSKCKTLTTEGFRRQCEVNIQLEKQSKLLPPPKQENLPPKP